MNTRTKPSQCSWLEANERRAPRAALFLLLFLLLPTAVVEAQFNYTNNGDGTATITGYTGPGGVVTIPSTIDGLPVTSVGDWAFYNGGRPQPYTLTGVTIPDSVLSIGRYAFAWSGSLRNVTLGNGLTSIGEGAFGDCGLTTITIPRSVSSIGDLAFAYGALTGVYFLGNAPSLGGPSVFQGFGAYPTVYYVSGTTGWGPTFGGCPTALWFPPPSDYTYTTTNGTITITGYTGPGGDVTIPDTIIGLPVTGIGNNAFYWCTSLTNVTIGSGVTSIGDWAFGGCSGLTRVTIPNSVTCIGGWAFDSCTGLTSVTIGESVTCIGEWAFDNCASLVSATIPNSVTNIGNSAFQWCTGLTSITIGDSVSRIGNDAFMYTSLTNITVDPYNSAYSSLNGVLFDKGQNLLIQYPSGNVATSYTIPNSVTNIGDSAFECSYCLTNVTIGSGVTRVGNLAFDSCTSLTALHFGGNAPALGGSSVFTGDTSATVYYLPGTTGWGATYGGRPTALWFLPNPLILTSGPGLGVQSNAFGFIISWATNLPVVVEASTNLANPIWAPVRTNTLVVGSAYFSDPQWTNYPGRFYRLRWP